MGVRGRVKKDKPLVIKDKSTLFSRYEDLKAGDIVAGRINLRPFEENLLLDLAERRVLLIPSALSQMASRSKAFQARLFAPLMVPHTSVVYTLHDLTGVINLYHKHAITCVVTKHDRRHAGLGIHLWDSVENVNNQVSFGGMQFPFVIQPFCPGCRDIRVVMLGDYLEVYERRNPYNFRNNLHCGGESNPYELSDKQLQLCRQATKRGKFPYAHIDIMVMENDFSYLAEINLSGGLKGAKIDRTEYNARVESINGEYLKKVLERVN